MNIKMLRVIFQQLKDFCKQITDTAGSFRHAMLFIIQKATAHASAKQSDWIRPETFRSPFKTWPKIKLKR